MNVYGANFERFDKLCSAQFDFLPNAVKKYVGNVCVHKYFFITQREKHVENVGEFEKFKVEFKINFLNFKNIKIILKKIEKFKKLNFDNF